MTHVASLSALFLHYAPSLKITNGILELGFVNSGGRVPDYKELWLTLGVSFEILSVEGVVHFVQRFVLRHN